MGLNTEVNSNNKLTEEFKKLLENDFKDRKLEENNIVSAIITEITKKYVVVDLKAKQEGMIPIEEFKHEIDKIKIGQKIEVFLDRIESHQGEIIVSRDKAKKLSTWKKMEKFFETQEEIEGRITSKIKGGVICMVEGLPTFMPQSQIDIKPPKRIDHLINVPIKVIATKIDRFRGNVCTSRRAVLEKSKNEKVKELIKTIKEGDVIDNAIVKACTDWGVFLDIQGADALIHISDLSWSKVKKPSDIISIGQKIKVKIIKIDKETSRISASIKALTLDPYANIEKKYVTGKIYKGKITRIVDFGMFLKLEEGVEGLCHSTQLSWGKNTNANKNFSVGQTVEVKIMDIDKANKKISLSYKETLDNPISELKKRIGDTFEGTIEKITNIALLVKIEDNLTGMVHFKQISYSENKEKLKDYSLKQKIKVKLIDVEGEKIFLSIRALEKDPMLWFAENNKKLGDIITTTVKEVMKTGIKVSIGNSNELVTTIKKNQLAKEVSDQRPEIYQPGNKIDALITELDLNNRQISLSVKQAQIKEEKSLIKKFGKDASTSGAKLKDIFSKAFSFSDSKKDKNKEEK